MKKQFVVMCTIFVAGLSMVCEAGERGPGKHSGVVVFDRWDGCVLYSGVYLMYISENAKEGLRQYAGQSVQINSKEVSQPQNPGDGLIRKFEYLGKAPVDSRPWVQTEGLDLGSSVTVGKDGKAIVTITIANKGANAIKLYRSKLALTLLMKRQEGVWCVADGPSFALFTRQSFGVGSDEPRWEGQRTIGTEKYSWTIGEENALPRIITVEPEAKKEIRITFDLPDDEYDFLSGYGGGVHAKQCLASNLSAFDVKGGKAKLVEIKNR